MEFDTSVINDQEVRERIDQLLEQHKVMLRQWKGDDADAVFARRTLDLAMKSILDITEAHEAGVSRVMFNLLEHFVVASSEVVHGLQQVSAVRHRAQSKMN